MKIELNNLDAAGIFQGRANRIVTERLDIAPLTREEAEFYLTDVEEYAKVLGLAVPPCEPDPDTRDALNWLIDMGLRLDSTNYVYGAIWAIVDRETRSLVANASFKGEPIEGDAEIGYGVDEPYRGRGYMTEALLGFVEWGKSRPELRGIVAETLKENVASQRCLIHAGFSSFGDSRPEDDGVFWRIDVL